MASRVECRRSLRSSSSSSSPSRIAMRSSVSTSACVGQGEGARRAVRRQEKMRRESSRRAVASERRPVRRRRPRRQCHVAPRNAVRPANGATNSSTELMVSAGATGNPSAGSRLRMLAVKPHTSTSPTWVRVAKVRCGCEVCNAIGDDGSENCDKGDGDVDGHHGTDSAVGTAIRMVRFYKSCISPLKPKSCRFVPTCSSYSIQAFEEYGFWKGFALTAWRILRCTPVGGHGYDPPKWPPPPYLYVGLVPPSDPPLFPDDDGGD